jgi:hypothetical protein
VSPFRGGLDDNVLVTQASLDDLAAGGTHDEVVWVGRTGDNRLSQTGIRLHHALPALASERVGSEEHACYLGVSHALDDHCQTHRTRINAQAVAVAGGAVGPQRGEAALHCIEHRLDPDDIEIGFLLPGKTCGR